MLFEEVTGTERAQAPTSKAERYGKLRVNRVKVCAWFWPASWP